MKKSIVWAWFLVMMLASSSIACALTGGDEPSQGDVAEPATETDVGEADVEDASDASDAVESQSADPTAAPAEPIAPTQTVPPAPTETSEPAPVATEEPTVAQSLNFAPGQCGLDALDSYEMYLSMSFEGQTQDGQPATGGVEGLIMLVTDPPANSMALSIFGDSELGDQEIEFAQVGETVYASLGALGCVSGSASEMGPMTDGISQIADPNELFQELENADFVGVELRGGIESDCYAFDETSLTEPDSDFDTLDGTICLATEQGFVTYLRVEGEGKSSEFGGGGAEAYGQTVIEVEVSRVNEPMDITPPASCQEMEVDYPVMDDATNVSQFEGFFSYSTAASFEEVLAFYQSEMEAAGYVAGDEAMILAENQMATLNYSKDEVSLTISLTPGAEGSGMQVFIVSE